jgi:hypothetical protein
MRARLRRSAEDKQGSKAEKKDWRIFQSSFPSMGLFIGLLSHRDFHPFTMSYFQCFGKR